MRITVIVPTLNPGQSWDSWVHALLKQSHLPETVLIVDSGSQDDTVNKALRAGFDVHVIDKSTFNHGATRQKAVNISVSTDIYIFLTQDAILADSGALKNIIKAFEASDVGVAYGRQLPREGAGPIEAHARFFNYSDQSFVRSIHDKNKYGMKTVFLSNSFAAYRSTALAGVGGFPDNTIVSEDMYVAAKMLISGWKVAYCSDACVFHSHNYSLRQEFGRYFDIGVFNAREKWIRERFGGAEGEGIQFVKSELNYLLKNRPSLIPVAILRTAVKLIGYRVGLIEARLPLLIKRSFSMQKSYWSRLEFKVDG